MFEGQGQHARKGFTTGPRRDTGHDAEDLSVWFTKGGVRIQPAGGLLQGLSNQVYLAKQAPLDSVHNTCRPSWLIVIKNV